MSNKIIFTAVDEYANEVSLKPYPAYQSVPKWWKDMPTYNIDRDNPTGKRVVVKDNTNNGSPKKCTPMLDAITAGYIIPLWTDIQIRSLSDSEYVPGIFWKVRRDVFFPNTDASRMIEGPDGYYSATFKYINQWMIKTPRGYSVAMHQPAGYEKLPLKAIPSVVDTDKFNSHIPISFWIKDGYEGIVEKGTPLVQVTPFKRESWSAEYNSMTAEEFHHNQERTIGTTLLYGYVKNFWSKKEYK